MKGRGSNTSDTPTWKITEGLSVRKNPSSELHCTDLAAHSPKHMNLLVALEVLRVNMIPLSLRAVQVLVTAPRCETGLVTGTAAESITPIRRVTQAHLPTQHIPCNRRPADVYQLRVPFCIPTGCPGYWIGVFVPKR